MIKDTDGSKPGDRCDPGPVYPECESGAFLPDDNLKGAETTNFPTAYCGVLEQCRKEAILRGDGDTLQAFPVLYQLNQVPRWEPLPYEAVKELRKSVRTYGVQSTFTYNLLVAIGDSYVMTPHDWKSVLRMILSPMQYTVFMTEYRDQAAVQALNNLNNLNHIGLEELMGEGVRATPQAQAQLDRQCLEQVKTLVLRAVRRVPDINSPDASFTSIRQEATEPYIKFLDRLQNSLERQVENEAARNVLLKQLAVENANADCRKVLKSLRNADPSITDLIKACQDVGTESHKMALLADSLATQLDAGTAQKVKCYNCGEPGHVQRDCKKPKRVNKNASAVPTRPCPRCRKGLHWARDCRSKLPVAAQPCDLPGNGKRSARPRAMTANTVPTQPDAVWPAHSDQPPLAAQEWICPLPSQ